METVQSLSNAARPLRPILPIKKEDTDTISSDDRDVQLLLSMWRRNSKHSPNDTTSNLDMLGVISSR